METKASEEFETKHKDIKEKLMSIELPDSNVTNVYHRNVTLSFCTSS